VSSRNFVDGYVLSGGRSAGGGELAGERRKVSFCPSESSKRGFCKLGKKGKTPEKRKRKSEILEKDTKSESRNKKEQGHFLDLKGLRAGFDFRGGRETGEKKSIVHYGVFTLSPIDEGKARRTGGTSLQGKRTRGGLHTSGGEEVYRV